MSLFISFNFLDKWHFLSLTLISSTSCTALPLYQCSWLGFHSFLPGVDRIRVNEGGFISLQKSSVVNSASNVSGKTMLNPALISALFTPGGSSVVGCGGGRSMNKYFGKKSMKAFLTQGAILWVAGVRKFTLRTPVSKKSTLGPLKYLHRIKMRHIKD